MTELQTIERKIKLKRQAVSIIQSEIKRLQLEALKLRQGQSGGGK